MNRHRALQGILAALLVIMAGCATYKLAQGPLEVSYVLAKDYEQAQLTAIAILGDPNVHAKVKDGIKRADAAGNPAMHAVAESAKRYAQVKAEIDAIKAAGGDPTAEKVQESMAALEALKASILAAQPLVQQLISAIRG